MSTEPTVSAAAGESGKSLCAIVYLLYLLSLPSIGTLMIVGVIIAFAARGSAAPWVRTHYDKEIKLFWRTLLWTIGLAVAWGISALLTVVLIGFPMLWIVGIAGLLVAVWYHVVSFIGLMRLVQDKPAD